MAVPQSRRPARVFGLCFRGICCAPLTPARVSIQHCEFLNSPEAVPFLSELLEDADAETRSCALELMNTLEQSNTGLLEEE